ncbi:TniQ family protein [Pseudomonas sp. CFII64]|uniref:TniQ family protein n=1 Tax=Pseudomonas sp. CFII64 TaxID=911242 RepID=UPI00041BE92C
MGTSYSWHPGARGLRSRWPITPALLPDELLSSWLVRAALAHGCSPESLTSTAWPGYRAFCRDIDRGMENGRLSALVKATGITYRELSSSTLQSAVQSLLGTENQYPVGVLPWILVLGCRKQFHAGGLQCCPDCMDLPDPHYVIQNRLAWHTVCPAHHVQLIDHCDHCYAALQPALLHPGALMSNCHQCGKGLSSFHRLPAAPQALAFQMLVDRSCGKPMCFGNIELCFRDWMSTARAMITFLQTAARHPSANVERFCEAIGFDPAWRQRTLSGLPFEYLRPGERARLLGNVVVIMQAGPEKFMEMAINASLPESILPLPVSNAPRLLIHMASVLTKHPRKTTSQTCHKPSHDQRQVLRMWIRLQRRVRRNDI